MPNKESTKSIEFVLRVLLVSGLLSTLIPRIADAVMIKFTSGKTIKCTIVKRGRNKLLLSTPTGHKYVTYDQIYSIQKGTQSEKADIRSIKADLKRYKRELRDRGESPFAVKREKERQTQNVKRRNRRKYIPRDLGEVKSRNRMRRLEKDLKKSNKKRVVY